MPIKRDAMPIKRDAMPMYPRRYADKKAHAWRAWGGTLSRWLEPQDKLGLALGAVLDVAFGDNLQSHQLGHSAAKSVPKVTHTPGVLHLVLEPVQRVPLHRVRGCCSQSLQRLCHVLALGDLQTLYETILDKRLLRPAFQRKMLALGILERVAKRWTGGAHKAPYLYRFLPKMVR